MLAAIVRGFLLGPVLVVVAMMALAMPMHVVWVLLAGVAVAVAIVAAIIWAPAPSRRRLPPPLPGDTTLTSTARPVRATARENLASDNHWRKAFTGWRYGSAPKGK